VAWWVLPSKEKPAALAAAVKPADAKQEREQKDVEKKPIEKKITAPPIDGKKADAGKKDGSPVDPVVGKKADPPPVDPFKDKDKGALPPPPPGAFNVIFDPTGSYVSRNMLNQFDPNNQFLRRHKLYLVHVEAGNTYQIDLTTQTLGYDPYLFLFDDTNKLIAQDDDGGGFPNARIVFRANRTGVYRIHASHYGFLPKAGNFTVIVRRFGGK
jgi:hypothetical protein